MLAGAAAIKPGAAVHGSIWLIGGTCEVAGSVAGDVTGLAGRLTISESAQITGDVVLAGSFTDIAPNAQIRGKVTESFSGPARQQRPFAQRVLPALQLAVLVAALATALGYWFAPALSRVGSAAVKHPGVSLATGVLAGITGLVILVLVGFTLILLPLALLLGLGVLAAVALGWVGLGAWLAARLAPDRMPVPLAVALGSLLFVTAVQLGSLVPRCRSIHWFCGSVLGTGCDAHHAFRLPVLPARSHPRN